jgi:hypothetical protein
MTLSVVIPGRVRSTRTRNPAPGESLLNWIPDRRYAASGMTAASYVRLANSTSRLVMALFGSVMGSQMVK